MNVPSRHAPRHAITGAGIAFALVAIAFALAGCHTESLPNYPPAYRAYAYVTDGKSNEVSVIDLLDFHQLRDIPVGQSPTGIAANPNLNEVYVVNTDSGSLSVVDAERNVVSATVPLHKKPYFIDLDKDAKLAVVANSGSNDVSLLDLAPDHQPLPIPKVIANIAVGKAPGMARLTADGTLAIVSNRGDGTVSVIDVARRQVRSTVRVCATPEDVAVLPWGTKAYVSCSDQNQVAVIALASPQEQTNTASAAAPQATQPQQPSHKSAARHARIQEKALQSESSGPDKLLALLDVGKSPVQIVVKPDGGEAFISNFGSDSVSEMRTDTDEVSSTHLLGSQPSRALVSPDNGTLYVSDFGSNSVSVFDIQLAQFDQAVTVGERPDALAFTPDGRFLLVADSGSSDVAVIRRAAANQLVTMVPVGLDPRQIAVKDFMLNKPPQ